MGRLTKRRATTTTHSGKRLTHADRVGGFLASRSPPGALVRKRLELKALSGKARGPGLVCNRARLKHAKETVVGCALREKGEGEGRFVLELFFSQLLGCRSEASWMHIR
eukprot:6325830-Pyramimonas_sp.AAC.1